MRAFNNLTTEELAASFQADPDDNEAHAENLRYLLHFEDDEVIAKSLRAGVKALIETGNRDTPPPLAPVPSAAP